MYRRSSGHASHKGTSDKPNVNANADNDLTLSAADKISDPQDVLPERVMTTETVRTDEFVDYPPATQRPDEDANVGKQES
ncbi:MAG: hypothetical protein SAK29_19350 [Scytonema sp. PMC 1069.18]|nr:hypothetical protein [Scytonema sp. PMC 1069.18]MEC4886725.1 hypothetical protein [Scytonema sp. PMC 1070.18]